MPSRVEVKREIPTSAIPFFVLGADPLPNPTKLKCRRFVPERMNVKGISWVGLKTDDVEGLADFFRRVLRIPVLLRRSDFVVFRTRDGDQVELFGPKGPDPPHQFASNRLIVGFLVDDLEAACLELNDAGIELLGPLQRDPHTGGAWQHFRGPDGYVYELTYDPSHP